MKPQHYAVLGSALAALAIQIGGLHQWGEATTPTFVSGAILQIATAVVAIFTPKPGTEPAPQPAPKA